MIDLSLHYSTAEAIASLLYPHAEVVIHDLTTGLIAAIYNNMSKRKVGDESLIEELKDPNKLPNVFPAYSKTNWDGRRMKASTATLRDKKGKPIGLLCINLDISQWESMHQLLGTWLHGGGHSPPDVLFKEDWRERINSFVTAYLAKEGTTLKGLSKEKKRELVLDLHQAGAFKAKNAANYVGEVLELSRATIYNYLR